MLKRINKEEVWLRKTQKTFDLIAKKFSETRKKKDEILTLFFSLLKPQGKILEIGSGSARTLEYLKKQGFFNNFSNSYLGIDYSANLISEAKKKKETKLYLKKIKFRKENLEKLKYKNEFDYAIALASIHHLPKSFQFITLKKIYQSLKKKAIFAGYVWSPNKKIVQKWQKLGENSYLKFWENETHLPIFYYCFSKKELRDLLKKVGFSKIQLLKNKDPFCRIKENIFFIAYKN